MKPLTRYEHDCAYVHGDYFSRMVSAVNGDWYAKDEADARFAELEADNAGLRSITLQQADRIAAAETERDAARAEVERQRSFHYAAVAGMKTVRKDVAKLTKRLSMRGNEVAALKAEVERLRDYAASALGLLARMRLACGDNGARMQDELEAYLRGLRANSERYEWLCSNESYAMFVEAEDKAALDAAIDAARGAP